MDVRVKALRVGRHSLEHPGSETGDAALHRACGGTIEERDLDGSCGSSRRLVNVARERRFDALELEVEAQLPLERNHLDDDRALAIRIARVRDFDLAAHLRAKKDLPARSPGRADAWRDERYAEPQNRD